MNTLAPDRLKELWHCVERKQLTVEEFYLSQEGLLAEHRRTWERALLLEKDKDLQETFVAELGRYLGCHERVALEEWCRGGVAAVEEEWQENVDRSDRQSVERFYDRSVAYLYDLMWWHTLRDDASPLAYVVALQFAQDHGCQHYLDFGAGVGSGGILFARHGLETVLADISSTLLRFSQWRFAIRNLPVQCIDLKIGRLPSQAFDVITAMDVFEHLYDPVGAVEELWNALKPGGFLIGRFHGEIDEQRPQHIMHDFGPTFQRLQALGGVEVWRDEWLWGHQVFQKT